MQEEIKFNNFVSDLDCAKAVEDKNLKRKDYGNLT